MKDVKTLFRMIYQVNYILNSKQKIQFIGLLFLGIGCAFMQTFGVSAILPFIQAIMTPEVIMENEYVQPFLIQFHITDSNTVIFIVAAGIVLVYILKNLYLIIANYIQVEHFHQPRFRRLWTR